MFGRTQPACSLHAQNDGQLVVHDGSGATVWSSVAQGGSSSAAQGWLYQISSGGLGSTRCIESGPSPAAVRLESRSRRYSLRVSQQGAALQLMDANGTIVWAPQGAQPGSPPARMCMTAAGQLLLSGAPSGVALWRSSYAVGPASPAPFVAQVSDVGCLEVLDGRCELLYSSTTQGRAAATPSKPMRSEPAARQRTARQPAPVDPAKRSRASPAPWSAIGYTQGSGNATQKHTKRLPPSIKPMRNVTGQAPPLAQQAAGAAPTCTLPAKAPCGGVELCGTDAHCQRAGCCEAPLACRRTSEFLWLCEANRP